MALDFCLEFVVGHSARLEVRAQRNRLGWSQVTLGEKIGYSGSFVSDVERCERPPSADFAKGCDREFGLPETMVRLYALIQRNAYPAGFSPVVPLERKAVRIHGWQPFVIPDCCRPRSTRAS